ncbi:MAG: hypothetical protein HQK54_15435 [Oligoflexales bacterium]|nr:hypothetical protein [Oligoflexales bacterium]
MAVEIVESFLKRKKCDIKGKENRKRREEVDLLRAEFVSIARLTEQLQMVKLNDVSIQKVLSVLMGDGGSKGPVVIMRE